MEFCKKIFWTSRDGNWPSRTLDLEGVSGGGAVRSVLGSPQVRAETTLDICVKLTSQNWVGPCETNSVAALFLLVLEILWKSKQCKESEQVYATLEKDAGLRPLMITIRS